MTDPSRPLLAGRYDLLDRIGAGGAGEVWRARDTQLDRIVAIKQIRLAADDEVGSGAATRARALREARLAARLSDPGAVTIYDVIEEPTTVSLVMELVDAPDLATVVGRGGPVSPRRAARIGRDVLRALRAAHAQGLVHRDVKPANILVPDEGPARLTDFGTAVLVGDDRLTRTGLVIGSPAFMSAEQSLGEEVDARSDLWSLAATLIFAVEGVPPFDGGSAVATAHAVAYDAPRPPTTGGPLDDVLLACLARRPADRPSADRLLAVLDAIADGRTPPPETRTSTAVLEAVAPPPDATAGPASSSMATVSQPTDAAPQRGGSAPAPAAMAPAAAAGHAASPPEAPTPTADGPWPSAVQVDPGRRRRLLAVGLIGTLLLIAAVTALAMGTDDDPAVDDPPADSFADGGPAATDLTVQPTPDAGQTDAAAAPGQPGATAPPAEAPVGEGEGDAEGQGGGGQDEAGQGDAGEDDGGGDDGADDDEEEGEGQESPDADDAADVATFGGGEVPNGWATFAPDHAPYTVQHPPSWQADRVSDTITDLRSPNGATYLRLDWTDDPRPDPLANWQELEADFSGRRDGYELLRLEPARFKGEEAAIWEYRYEADGVLLHAYNLNVSGQRYGYALNLVTEDDRWDEAVVDFEGLAASYTIPG